jgi:hypothetical protein
MAREGTHSEFTRDLLFLPTPAWFEVGEGKPNFSSAVVTNCWKGHYTNVELVSMPFFWEQVLAQVRKLRSISTDDRAVEVIALNFGRWESKRAADPYALECHGHAHLLLSEKAQYNLSQKTAWNALRGRHYAPAHYGWADACSLETLYVLPDEMKSVSKKLDNLTTTLTDLTATFTEFTTIFRAAVAHFPTTSNPLPPSSDSNRPIAPPDTRG